jgi:trk system potassium uptake protein TrkH
MYELVSPVNFAAVTKYTAQIMIGIGGVMVAPLLVALAFGETSIALLYGAMGAAVMVLGYMIHRLLPHYELDGKDAVVIAAIIFPLSSLVSTVPFMMTTGMAPIDAYFEAVSGITTTGLSVAPVDVGPVFLFARSWLQWVGGIGIVLIVLSLPLIHPGTSAIRLYTIHAGDEKPRPSVTSTAQLLGTVYIAITAVAFVILLYAGMEPFDALCHALCSVSTGGFSTRPDSIAAFAGTWIWVAAIVAFTLGSVNFTLYSRAATTLREAITSPQLIWFFLIAAGGIVLLAFTLIGTGTGEEVAGIAIFQGFSALTTTGYATVDIGTLPATAKAVITALMWIGGSVGSTAGGIKILRVIILARVIHMVFIRFFLPAEALTPLKVGADVVETEEVHNILTFISLYSACLVVSCFLLMLHGFPMENALFEVSSALGTVGLSCGITAASLPLIPKLVLIANMLLGRIEIIPLAILFFPRTWIRR